MNGIIYAVIGTSFAFIMTTLGAANVFFFKKKVSVNIKCILIGFSAGVMIAASIWSLLIPAIDKAQELGQIGWIPTAGGFILGVVFLLWLDYLFTKMCESNIKVGVFKKISKQNCLLILAVTLHNIPEGMAIGLAFAIAATGSSETALMTGAVTLALGIGIQNFPEGATIALPLRQEGIGRGKAFGYGVASGSVEPVAGIITALFAYKIQAFLPWMLAFAAGSMIYVVVEELIPEAHLCDKANMGTLGVITGFLVMMILDVALG